MKLIEWGEDRGSDKFEITQAELQQIVFDCSIAYADELKAGRSIQEAEWKRTKTLGKLIRKLSNV